jgi:hypothetical protein
MSESEFQWLAIGFGFGWIPLFVLGLYAIGAVQRVSAIVRVRRLRWGIRRCTAFDVDPSIGTVRCSCGRLTIVMRSGAKLAIEYTSCPLWKAIAAGEVREVRLLQ